MQKEKLLQLVAQHMESNIAEIHSSQDDYETASSMEGGETSDPEDFSQKSEKKELQYQMQIQLDIAESNFRQLKEFIDTQYEVAKSGALIETDKNYFLMGVAFPSVHAGKKEIIGVSPDSPAYAILNGKLKGDDFKLGTHEYTILDIA
ncbi:MAG: hypothetical protein ABJC12_04090 [Saprospiraceae bacterium]